MPTFTIRPAQPNEAATVLEFIKKLAEYEKLYSISGIAATCVQRFDDFLVSFPVKRENFGSLLCRKVNKLSKPDGKVHWPMCLI